MKAMILAAGFGTRLFPLTIDRTKPAIPFLGKPLVGYVAHYLAKYGFRDVVVNLHHQPESVKMALGDGSDFGVNIQYTYEKPKILGTAGALDNAREFLDGETFLVANGKIVTDIDLEAALETHLNSGALATMILKSNPEFERFTEVFVENSAVTGFGAGFPSPSKRQIGQPSPYMFTGIHILEPAVFDYIPRGVYSDIVPTFYNPAIKAGEKISAHIATEVWHELSTMRRYLDITLSMLKGQRNVIGESVRIAESAIIEDSIVWDNVVIEDDARITRSIVGDDVTIKRGETYENMAIVRHAMLEHLGEMPEKSLAGNIQGDNYVVSIDQ